MKMRTCFLSSYAISFCVCAFLVCGAGSVSAQDRAAAPSRADTVLDSMPRAQWIGDAAISPDGSLVAYTASQKIQIIAASGGSARTISVDGNLPASDLAWSADSKRIAFIAALPGEVPAAQVWTAAADGSAAPTKHADLKGNVQTPRFSPDGSKLSVLFIEGIPRIAGPLEPMIPLSGVIGIKIYEQRIATIDLATNHLNQVTPDDVYVYEYEWTPDGQAWVATAAHGSGDANWYVARLYVVSLQDGQMREIYKPTLQIADPRISPNGKNVAFIEGLMSDEGSTGGDIYVVPTTGGEAQNLTPNIKASPSALAWTGNERITFSENVDGNSGFGSVGSKGGALQLLWTGEEVARPSGSWWASQKLAATSNTSAPISDSHGTTVITTFRALPVTAIVRQAGSTAPEVWAGAIGSWKQLTTLNAGLKPAWGETRNVHWVNGDTRVQGWLMLPKDYDPAKKYPLVVTVHGGPSAACEPYWGAWGMAPTSAMGYFSLCPNPRGSYGQGEAFVQANVKDFGGGDFRDIMAGIDSLLKEYPIDSKRLGIHGHSYGGYMTMWAETQTNRFAAAVAGAGLSDWLSYYGLNDIDEWMIPFFGASVYDDPAVYAKSDPMHFIKAVKTPTLILVGDRDGEVPMEQSVEWWHALVDLHVPTTLVVYPNEGHAIGKPADARDYALRSLEWFEEWFAKAQ